MLEYIITGKNLDRVLLNSRCPEHHGFGTIMSVNNNLFSYIRNKCMEMTRASNFDRTSPEGNLKFQKILEFCLHKKYAQCVDTY